MTKFKKHTSKRLTNGSKANGTGSNGVNQTGFFTKHLTIKNQKQTPAGRTGVSDQLWIKGEIETFIVVLFALIIPIIFIRVQSIIRYSDKIASQEFTKIKTSGNLTESQPNRFFKEPKIPPRLDYQSDHHHATSMALCMIKRNLSDKRKDICPNYKK